MRRQWVSFTYICTTRHLLSGPCFGRIQVTFALQYMWMGDFSAANQTVNRLRAWSDLKRTSFFCIQQGKGDGVVSLGHIIEMAGITRPGVPSRAKDTTAKVWYKEQQQHTKSRHQREVFFRDIAAGASHREDGPWQSLPIDRDLRGAGWVRGGRRRRGGRAVGATPDRHRADFPGRCRKSLSAAAQYLSTNLTRYLLKGRQRQDDGGGVWEYHVTLGEVLHEQDSGDIVVRG